VICGVYPAEQNVALSWTCILQYMEIHWENPIAFCWGSPCHANFKVALQKYVITAPLCWRKLDFRHCNGCKVRGQQKKTEWWTGDQVRHLNTSSGLKEKEVGVERRPPYLVKLILSLSVHMSHKATGEGISPLLHLHHPALAVVIISPSCLCFSDLPSNHYTQKLFYKGKSDIHLSTSGNSLHWEQECIHCSQGELILIWKCLLWTEMFFST